MATHVALIPGVTGVVGRALARVLSADPDWSVIGVARRAPAGVSYPVIEVDITDRASALERLSGCRDVTHVLYCARYAHMASVKEPVGANADMMHNVLDAMEKAAPRLQHVHFVQGSKVYGSDLGPYKTPAKESDPRVADDNWYYAQEDMVVERAGRRGWSWTCSRPHGVCDPVPGHARSMVLMIGIYAAIAKAEGRPLDFPGTPEGFHALYQSVDAELLARAIAWVTTRPACANHAFNITNGDYMRWENFWPRVAAFFDLKPGAVVTAKLADTMKEKAPVWDAITAQHDLAPTPYPSPAVWSYADFNWLRGQDKMSDTMKLRLTGFTGCMDTEEMYIDHLRILREARVIP